MSELKDGTAARTPEEAVVWTPEHRATIEGWVEKWRGLLLLNGHHFNLVFSETPDKDDPDTCAASISVNLPYMSGHAITVYPRLLAEPDTAEQERKIVHELAHVLTRRLRGLAHELISDKFVAWREVKDADEATTDWIANIAFALYTMERE